MAQMQTMHSPRAEDRIMNIVTIFRNIAVVLSLFMMNTISVSAVPELGVADSKFIESGENKQELANFANKRVIEEKVQIFQEILQDLDVSFVDPVDINKLAETGFNAMLNSLDPYTEFETPKAAKELRTQTSGNYGGVGLVVGRVQRGATESDVDAYPYVIKALEGFAFDAGIRVGVRPLLRHILR
jgi:C-terminal processing protease CtpA/Prc